MMTFPDSVEYLYALGNEVKTIKMGLERIGVLLTALDHPQRACRFVHVAGTNGKGSTCAMIESGLRAAARRTGLYTSPHLVTPTERIQVDGRQVTPEEFAGAFHRIHQVAGTLLDAGSIDAHPTYFETVTAMAFLLFRDFAVDTVVLEVGLGGRLDATNVVIPELSVITPIDFDHESWLGSSLRAIAGEKAGIIKPGVPVLLARQRGEALERLLEAAAEAHSPVHQTSSWRVENAVLHPRGCRFTAVHGDRAITVECPLAGEHQVENTLAAVAALVLLGIDDASIQQGIRMARWPGRLEKIAEKPEIILDGAHNPAGVRALAAYIQRFYQDRKVWLVYATIRDKSVDEIGEVLSPLASEVILTAADSPRSLRPEVLLPLFPHPKVRTTQRLADAMEIVRSEASPEDAVFVTGSLFLVGEARRWMHIDSGFPILECQ